MPRWLKLVAALGLLAALYWHCDGRRVAAAVVGLDRAYLTLAFLMFVPQTLVSAWRWQRLVAPLCSISLLEATRQTLAASAWNLLAPSKLGDFTKAGMLPLAATERRPAWWLVIVEKVADVVALALMWLAGAAWVSSSTAMIGIATALTLLLFVICVRGGVTRVVGPSLLLWLLHLGQIHAMLLAAGVPIGFDLSLARVPAAIFAGLLPLSLCGIGTRDGALIWLFSDVARADTMAAVGLLTATRYLVPGAAGILCLWRGGAMVCWRLSRSLHATKLAN